MLTVEEYGHWFNSVAVLSNSTGSLRADQQHMCAARSYRWPGEVADYRIDPGEIRVLATGAVDHSSNIPDLADLSASDFEFLGCADVDNPAVPNIAEVGTRSYPIGHGLLFSYNRSLALIASATRSGFSGIVFLKRQS